MIPQPYKLPSETVINFKEHKLTDFFEEIAEYDSEHHVKLSADCYFLTVRGTYYNNYSCKPVPAVMKFLKDLEFDVEDMQFHIAYYSKDVGYLTAKRISGLQTVWLADLKGLDKYV